MTTAASTTTRTTYRQLENDAAFIWKQPLPDPSSPNCIKVKRPEGVRFPVAAHTLPLTSDNEFLWPDREVVPVASPYPILPYPPPDPEVDTFKGFE